MFVSVGTFEEAKLRRQKSLSEIVVRAVFLVEQLMSPSLQLRSAFHSDVIELPLKVGSGAV